MAFNVFNPWVLLALLIPIAVYAFLAWSVYLLFKHPVRFIEFFLVRGYRRWGIRIEVEDAARLKHQARVLGWMLLIFLATHATLVFGAIFRAK